MVTHDRSRALGDPCHRGTGADGFAQRVLECRATFEYALHRNKSHFPADEFDHLWHAVLDYCRAMDGSNWLHRDLAREISRLHQYLRMSIFNTPQSIFQKVELMNCYLFDRYDPGPEFLPNLQEIGQEDRTRNAIKVLSGSDHPQNHATDELSPTKPLIQKLSLTLRRLGTMLISLPFSISKRQAVDTKLGVTADIIKQVRQNKELRQCLLSKYCEQAKLGFIVHSFNRVSNIDQLLAGLRRLGNHEIIVCEDGSLDGSLAKWITHLDYPNDFLIRSNDIHEIRATDRAIRYTSAEIVCLVQDDDVIPQDTAWLDDVLIRFDRYADLAIIGGFMGFASFHPDPNITKPLWGPAPFQLVQHVNVGPYFIRKKHYEALGGWDYSFSAVGEPGIGFECELCLRAWLNGYQVGYSFIPFKGPPGHYSLDGGTVLFAGTERRNNQLRNHKKIFEMYAKHSRRIDQLVWEAGRRTGLPHASQALDSLS